jgi:DNA invertase Pin-like site-specific DNA recombinase
MILGYCRVSTQEQAAVNTTSLAAQEQVIRGIAMTRGATNYDVQIFSDPGVSGSIPLDARPAGRELLSIAKSGDIVCAAKLDRMFRSASDALVTAERLKEAGVKLILFDLGAEPVTDNGMAKCFFTMASAFAELERARISERMESGRDQKRQRSGHLGGVAPYGYRVVGEKRESRLEPVPEEQPILREVLDLSKQKLSSWTIMKQINEKGYKNREGKPFECYQVKRIIERAHADHR